MASFPGVATPCSPTDAIVLAILAPPVHDAHEVHNALTFPYSQRDKLKFWIVVPDYDGLRMFQDGLGVRNHKLRNMRNMIQDEILVCADETRNVYVPVVDAQIVTFP